jgi:hypothetical protein
MKFSLATINQKPIKIYLKLINAILNLVREANLMCVGIS